MNCKTISAIVGAVLTGLVHHEKSSETIGQAPVFLADSRRVLLLLSSLTGIETVCERMASAGLLVHEVASIRCPGERLVVLRGSRPPSFS